MQFTELTIRILFLFLPGIISTFVIDSLTSHRKKSNFNFLLHSYLLGIASYLGIALFVQVNNWIVKIIGNTPTWESTFVSSLLNSKQDINSIEVLSATIFSFFLAILIVKVINNKWYYRLFKKLKITNKHGEDDIWEYLLSSHEVEWINLRDKENGLIYQGAVRGYSDKDNKRELYLTQVIVYDENGESLYDMEHVYLNFDVSSNIIIDIYQGDGQNE